MAPTLYLNPPSPPVRSVQITARALGIALKETIVNTLKGEQLSPEFVKINPEHTVPTLVDDDGFVIWESHAINTYLVSRYAKNDSLYPKETKKRAVVDQRLFFDCGVVFPSMGKILGQVFIGGKTGFNDSDKEIADKIYGKLEAFLAVKEWVAGDAVTIADYSLYATISSLNKILPVNTKMYGKVAGWLRRAEALPEVEAGRKGLDEFESVINDKLKANAL